MSVGDLKSKLEPICGSLATQVAFSASPLDKFEEVGQLSAVALQSAGEKSHVARPYLRVEFPNDPIDINSDSIVTRVQHTVRNPPHQTDDFSRISIPTVPFAQGVPPQARPTYLGRVSKRFFKQ